MNVLNWMVRARRWAQNPPSEGRVKLVLGVIAACIMVVGIEYAFGWPDWMTVDGLRQKP